MRPLISYRDRSILPTSACSTPVRKNAGPAGVTVVIVRRDMIGHALPICPSAFDYANVARERSRFNTPPTYAIYIAGLVFKWLLTHGGLASIEAKTNTKPTRFTAV